MSRSDSVIDRTKEFSSACDLSFSFDGCIYNPLEYAWENHRKYLSISIRDGQRIMMLGMNPGPFGMVQNGVPFGDIQYVKDYLEIDGDVKPPIIQSPKRPVLGMESKRREVSGERIWGMASRFGNRDDFFALSSVMSYCPLAFIDRDGRNVTPPELPAIERKSLEAVCTQYIKDLHHLIGFRTLIAIGRYAYEKAMALGCHTILFPHPSPRNPSSSAFWQSGKALNEFRKIANED